MGYLRAICSTNR